MSRGRLKLLDAPVEAGAVTKSTAIDSTYIKAQRATFGAKGGRTALAIGRSRGGWTTKIHALTDVIGRPNALMLTPGNQRHEGCSCPSRTGRTDAIPARRQRL